MSLKTSKYKSSLCFWIVFFLGLIGGLAFFAKPIFLNLLLATQDWQRQFHDQIGSLLHAIHETHSFSATLSLALIGFIYGILHAVGPGHGKMVVSSYLLAGQNSFKRALEITFSAAFLQALMAVALVVGIPFLFGFSRDETQGAALLLERASLGLISLIGIVLFVKGGMEVWQYITRVEEKPRVKKLSLFLLILSIGLRPCSGALLLLLFASLVGVVNAGIIATFTMALGTAITTSFIAFLTIKSKAAAFKLSSPRSESQGRSLHLIHAGFSFFGGALILLFAYALFSMNGILSASSGGSSGLLATQQHPLMRSFSGD